MTVRERSTPRKISFLELAEKVLRRSKEPMTTSEIWQRGESYRDQLTGGRTKTPIASLGSALSTDKDRPSSKFGVTEDRPKKYYLKEASKKGTNYPKAPLRNTSEFVTRHREADLHSLLSYFAFHKLQNCYTKTIRHGTSKKQAYKEWIHPDLVGCCFYMSKREKVVREFARAVQHTDIKLISFELKRELTTTNLREAFFQSVSHSYWANESYLAAARVQDDKEFMQELTRLTSAFGVGIIHLDIVNPDTSEIIIPARTRANLDIDGIEKLSTNSDFKHFLESVQTDIISSRPDSRQYDEIPNKTALLSHLREKRTKENDDFLRF